MSSVPHDGVVPSPGQVPAGAVSSAAAATSATPSTASATPRRHLSAAAARVIRALSTELARRSDFSSFPSRTFDGRRDLYRALGYKLVITPLDYWISYKRGGIAKTIVEAFPLAMWAGGVDVIEDESPDTITALEQDVIDLDKRIKLWARVLRADILAGIGRYSVIFLGTRISSPAELEQPLTTLRNPADLLYLSTLPETNAQIYTYVTDPADPRFGLPEYYLLHLGTSIVADSGSVGGGARPPGTKSYKVHHSRVIHIAKGMLVDDVYGTPELEPVYNLLCDLDKVRGGGAEAAWSRADPGIHINFDPETVELDDDAIKELEAQLEAYRHDGAKYLQTQGGDVNLLQSNVTTFGPNCDSIIKEISATKRIPHRILVGSERGELSSTQDRDNWRDRVIEYRQLNGEPIARIIVDKLIAIRAVRPSAGGDYELSWPDTEDLNGEDKAKIALLLAQANQANVAASAGVIKTGDEIRDEYWGDAPLATDVNPDAPATTGSDSVVDDNPIPAAARTAKLLRLADYRRSPRQVLRAMVLRATA